MRALGHPFGLSWWQDAAAGGHPSHPRVILPLFAEAVAMFDGAAGPGDVSMPRCGCQGNRQIILLPLGCESRRTAETGFESWSCRTEGALQLYAGALQGGGGLKNLFHRS